MTLFTRAIVIRFMRAFTITVALWLLLLSPADAWAQSGGTSSQQRNKFVHVDELIEVLNSRDIDLIIETMNHVKGMRYQGEILPVIKDLWEGRQEKYPDLHWQTVNLDIVRLEIANILVQAQKNQRIKVDRHDLHNFVRGLLESEDFFVANNAILTLSAIDDPNDVEKILAIAKKQEPGSFRTAVEALIAMCNKKSREALDELADYVQSADTKAYILEGKADMDEFFKETSWCKQKF